ncbi:MAG: hypothetical protein WAM30_17210, partial [Candidatus Dormiibacterota bacterium]
MPTTIPHDLVFGLRTAAEPQIAPDGRGLLYALTEVDPSAPDAPPKSSLWTCRLDGSEATPLTDPGHRDGRARWSPDGSQVAFTSDRGEAQGLFVAPAGGGAPVQVASHPLAITWLRWSPDGRSIAYTVPVDPADPTQGPGPVVRVTRRLDYKEDMRGYLGDRRSHVFVAAADGSGTRQVTREAFDHLHPQWSPDGGTLAIRVLRAVSFRSQLQLLDVASGETREVGIAHGGTIGLAAWSPSGDRLLLAGEPERTSQLDFYLLTVEGLQVRQLTDDLEVAPDAGRPNSAG